jgi:class 3 adenylate cyclase
MGNSVSAEKALVSEEKAKTYAADAAVVTNEKTKAKLLSKSVKHQRRVEKYRRKNPSEKDSPSAREETRAPAKGQLTASSDGRTTTLTGSLAPFIPRTLVSHYLVQHPDASPATLQPSSFSLGTVALLMVDISGFTKLSEAMDPLPDGVEQEARAINSYFAAMVECIDRYSGDVVKIAGDALLVIFTDENSVPRAAAAATDILTKHGVHQPPELAALSASLSLRCHAAIVAGELYAMIVGGHEEEFEFIIAGRPLASLHHAIDASRAGDCVLDATAAKLAAPLFDSVELEMNKSGRGGDDEPELFLLSLASAAAAAPLDPSPWPTFLEWEPARRLGQPTLEKQLRAFVPARVYSVLDKAVTSGSSVESVVHTWLSSNEKAVIVFINIAGLVLSHDAPSLDLTQAALLSMQTIIHSLDGYRRQFLCDDKGSVLIAAFHGHEDDAVRAVKCALEVTAALTTLGLRHAIGVAGGSVYSGPAGAPSRMELSLLGSVVNMAARLSNLKRQGTIIVCPFTTDLACDRFHFEHVGNVALKGFEEPISIHRATAASAAATSFEPKAPQEGDGMLIGRDAEVATFTEAATAFKESADGTSFLVVGEKGMGKSKLLEHYFHAGLRIGLQLYLANGESTEKGTPFFPFRLLFRQLLGLDQVGDSVIERRFELQQIIQVNFEPDQRRLAPLLNAVLFVDLPETPATTELRGAARIAATKDLLVAVLTRFCAKRRSIILLEDVHFFDHGSRALLVDLMAAAPHTMIVSSTREPAPDDTRFVEEFGKLRAAAAHVVSLAPLTGDQSGSLVAARLRTGALPAALSKAVESSGGSPLHLTLLASVVLAEDALVDTSEGKRALRSSLDVTPLLEKVTSSLHGVVGSQIATLPDALIGVLSVMSVFGLEADVGRLARVYAARERGKILLDTTPGGSSPSPASLEVIGHLSQLQNRHFVKVLDADRVSFVHEALREASYERLTRAQRRRLHALIARDIEVTSRSAYAALSSAEALDAATTVISEGSPAVTSGAVQGMDPTNDQMLGSEKLTQSTSSESSSLGILCYHYAEAVLADTDSEPDSYLVDLHPAQRALLYHHLLVQQQMILSGGIDSVEATGRGILVAGALRDPKARARALFEFKTMEMSAVILATGGPPADNIERALELTVLAEQCDTLSLATRGQQLYMCWNVMCLGSRFDDSCRAGDLLTQLTELSDDPKFAFLGACGKMLCKMYTGLPKKCLGYAETGRKYFYDNLDATHAEWTKTGGSIGAVASASEMAALSLLGRMTDEVSELRELQTAKGVMKLEPTPALTNTYLLTGTQASLCGLTVSIAPDGPNLRYTGLLGLANYPLPIGPPAFGLFHLFTALANDAAVPDMMRNLRREPGTAAPALPPALVEPLEGMKGIVAGAPIPLLFRCITLVFLLPFLVYAGEDELAVSEVDRALDDPDFNAVVFLVPLRFFKALALLNLGRAADAQALVSDILTFCPDRLQITLGLSALHGCLAEPGLRETAKEGDLAANVLEKLLSADVGGKGIQLTEDYKVIVQEIRTMLEG